MGLRDRFSTPRTARAIMSWRILVGAGVGLALAVAGLPVGVAIGVGAGVYVVTVLAAAPAAPSRPSIDPFTVGEPWRQLMKEAVSADRKLRATVEHTPNGPLKDSLRGVAGRLDHALGEAWEVARRGDRLDDAVRRLDPTALRSKLATLQAQGAANPSSTTDAAIASTERQLATARRLTEQSQQTARSLRLTQTQLDELVARASEVSLGAIDTDTYRREVDDLVVRLEALHRAVEEMHTA